MIGSTNIYINIDFVFNMARSDMPERPVNPAPSSAVTTSGSAAFVSAKEAMQLLRVKPQTLYAYVSRGWIHSVGHDKRRGYLYLRDDIERLRSRGHAKAEGSLYKGGSPRWSEPIVQTSITTITLEGPSYRGHSALGLVRQNQSFESVAEMLWSGVWNDDVGRWPTRAEPVAREALMHLRHAGAVRPDFIKLAALYVMSLASEASGGDDLREGNTVVAARMLLTAVPGCFGFLTRRRDFYLRTESADEPVSLAAGILDSAGVRRTDQAVDAINAALVLLADHDLTPQTFAARLAASSGASLYLCIVSALSAHSGSRIRRTCDKVEDLLISANMGTSGSRTSTHHGKPQRTMPGFNHPLYPRGDPRALYLLALARELGPQSRGVNELIDESANEPDMQPSVEFGLVVLCQALRMPFRSASAILAVARSAGWIAHVIEQRLAGVMLRPRSRYLEG